MVVDIQDLIGLVALLLATWLRVISFCFPLGKAERDMKFNTGLLARTCRKQTKEPPPPAQCCCRAPSHHTHVNSNGGGGGVRLFLFHFPSSSSTASSVRRIYNWPANHPAAAALAIFFFGIGYRSSSSRPDDRYLHRKDRGKGGSDSRFFFTTTPFSIFTRIR